MASGTSTLFASPVPASAATPKWEKLTGDAGSFYRDAKRRITVALESPRYYGSDGELSSFGRKWILYRDSNGFREGEFDTPEEAMGAADKI